MESLPITPLDLAVGIVILISALMALANGAVRETLSIGSWVGAFAVAIYAYEPLKPFLKEAIQNELLTDIATIAVAFFVPLIVFRIITGMISRALQDSGLGALDRLVGLILGLARGAIIVVALYMIGSFFIPPDRQPQWVQTAWVKPYLDRGAAMVRQHLPQNLEERGEEAADAVRRGADNLQGAVEGYNSDTRRNVEDLINDQRTP